MKKIKITKDIVVLHHGDCPDGFGAAWAAYQKMGDTADYVPVQHGNGIPEGLVGKEIYMLDFCFPRDTMLDLIEKNKKITVIEHHITKEQDVKLAQEYVFDNNHSGAILSWQYFHPGQPAPLLLRYIEDQDIWKLEMANGREINSFIDSVDYNFDYWNKLAQDFEDSEKLKAIIEKGSIIARYEDELAKRLISENTRSIVLDGHKGYVINAPHEIASLISSILFKENKTDLLVSWVEEMSRVHVSLRSNGSINVGELAKKFGGGGHRSAAGFSLPKINIFPWTD